MFLYILELLGFCVEVFIVICIKKCKNYKLFYLIIIKFMKYGYYGWNVVDNLVMMV